MLRKIYFKPSALLIYGFTLVLCTVAITRPLIHSFNPFKAYEMTTAAGEDAGSSENETDNDGKESFQDDFPGVFNTLQPVISSGSGQLFAALNEKCLRGFEGSFNPPPEEKNC